MKRKIYILVETSNGYDVSAGESGGFPKVFTTSEAAEAELDKIVGYWNEDLDSPLEKGKEDDAGEGKWASRMWNNWEAWVDLGGNFRKVEIFEKEIEL